ncbi:MAG: Cys-Gln thioester bond-forming surface protein [Ruminococcus sp.]|nr:Cys-Gln thioester bond-forming surface protein [Ruminococcus sp.]
MKRKIITRVITAMMAVIICFSGIPSFSAGQIESTPDEAVLDLNNIELDEYGDVITNEELGYNLSSSGFITKTELDKLINSPAAMSAQASNVTIKFENCYDTAGNTIKSVSSSVFTSAGAEQYRFTTSNGDRAYCIEPGVYLAGGLSLSSSSTDAWDNLSPDQQKAINTTLCYGLEGSPEKVMYGTINEDQAYIATQLIIWEIVKGERSATTPFSLNSGKNGYLPVLCAGGKNPNIKAAYNNIVSRMSKYWTVPSFAHTIKSKAPTITLNAVYNERSGAWTYSSKTLNDANGVLSDFNLAGTYDVGNATVTVTQSDNSLTLTCSNGVPNGTPKTVSVKSHKSGIPMTQQGVLISYGSPSLQDIVCGGSIDPPNAYMNIEVNVKVTGTLTRDARIQKSCWTQTESDDDTVKEGEGSLSTEENLEGWYFKVKASQQFIGVYGVDSFILGPTDATGFTQSLSEYIIENIDDELTYDVPDGIYEFVELGKLKDGADGSDLENDYYFPEGWRPDTKYTQSGDIISGSIYFIGTSKKIDNIGYATNIFDIPFKLSKINADSASASGFYFTATNKETNDVYLLRTDNDGNAYLANDAEKNTKIYLPEGTYTIHELGKLKSGADGSNYETDYAVPEVYDTPTDIDVEISADAYKTAQEEGLDAIERTVVNTVSAYIEVSKTDGDTGDKLEGAVFGIYFDKECTSLLETITTNSSGKARSESKYAVGTYYVQEITAPENYILDTTVHTVVIEPKEYPNYTVTVNAVNESYPTKIQIYKTDEETSKPLEGVVFGIYKNQSCTVLLEKLTTNADGYAISSAYKPNRTVYIKEISTIPGYILSDEVKRTPIEETSNSDNIITVSFTNEINKVPVAIVKTDSETGDKLEGAVYGLYSDEACTKLLEELTTDKNGYAESKNTYRPSTMYLKEITPPTNYTVNNTVYTVTITVDDVISSEPVQIKVSDEIEKAKVLIYKYDPDIYANYKPVPGATYGLYYNEECTKLAEKLVTGKDGSALSTKEYRIGQTLYLKELIPAPGYKLNESVRTISITPESIEFSKTQVASGVAVPDGNFVWQKVFDLIYKPYIAVHKTDSATGVAVEGATYELYDPDNKYATRVFLTTDENGYAQAPSTYYPGQILHLRETQAADGYSLDETIYEIYVDYVKEDGFVIVKEVQDDPFAPRLTIKKTCRQTELPVAGAVYRIYNSNRTDTNGEILSQYHIGTVVTDNNGFAEIPIDFVIGDIFYVQEWSSGVPFGYQWNRTITKVVVEPDMDLIIRVNNPMKAGTVNITKTDSYGNILPGVTFEVYTADGKQVGFNKLSANTYYLTVNGATKTVTIPDSGTVSLLNMPLGDYYLLETSTVEGNMPYGERIEFSVKLANSNNTTAETVEITVVNNEAVMFNTGGNGDKVVYFIAGAVFILAVAFFIIASKRKSKVKDKK